MSQLHNDQNHINFIENSNDSRIIDQAKQVPEGLPQVEPSDQIQQSVQLLVSALPPPEDPVAKIKERLYVPGLELDEIEYNPKTGRPVRANRRPPLRLVMSDKGRKNEQYKEEAVSIDLKEYDKKFLEAVRDSDNFEEEDIKDIEQECQEESEDSGVDDDDVQSEELDDEENSEEEEDEQDLESEASESSAYLSDSDGSYQEGDDDMDEEDQEDQEDHQNDDSEDGDRNQDQADGNHPSSGPSQNRKRKYIADDDEEDDDDFIDTEDDLFPDLLETYQKMADPISDSDTDQGYEDESRTSRTSKPKRQRKKTIKSTQQTESVIAPAEIVNTTQSSPDIASSNDVNMNGVNVAP